MANLQRSLSRLKDELNEKEDGFLVKPALGFISNALFSFPNIDPNNLPIGNIALNVFVPKEQPIMLVLLENSLSVMEFAQFSSILSATFSQKLTPLVSPHHHILVMKNTQFALEQINSTEKFLAKKSDELTLIFSLQQEIIRKETAILNQLLEFQSMLSAAGIFQSPEKGAAKEKRSLFDIFSPYSLSETAQTSSINFERMNKNFKKVTTTEKRLSHDTKLLAAGLKTLSHNEKNLELSNLFLTYHGFITENFQMYLTSLNHVIKNIEPSFHLKLLFELLNNDKYCDGITCFNLPIFSKLNNNQIQISTHTSKQSLIQGVYISCNLGKDLEISIFSHQVGILDKPKNILNFKDPGVPSLNFSDIHTKKFDVMTRPLGKEDLIEDVLFPVFFQEKIAFQCVNATKIFVDTKPYLCERNSVHFVNYPKKIEVKDIEISLSFMPQHFFGKTNVLKNSMQSPAIFKAKKLPPVPLHTKIVGLFKNATPLHYSTVAIAIFAFFLLVTVCCMLSFLKIPHLLLPLFCCCNDGNSLKKKVLKRAQRFQQKKYYRNASAPILETNLGIQSSVGTMPILVPNLTGER